MQVYQRKFLKLDHKVVLHLSFVSKQAGITGCYSLLLTHKGDSVMYSKGKEIFPRFPSCSFWFNCFIKEVTVTGVSRTAPKWHLWPALTCCWLTQQSTKAVHTEAPGHTWGSVLSAPLSKHRGALISGICLQPKPYLLALPKSSSLMLGDCQFLKPKQLMISVPIELKAKIPPI